MPKNKKDLPKKQAKRGNLPLPVDVIDELRDWKFAYELAWSDPDPDGEQYTMTYEQLIRRLWRACSAWIRKSGPYTKPLGSPARNRTR